MKKSKGARSQYQRPAAKGGAPANKRGSKGRSAYQSLSRSPRGRNAH